MEYIMKKILQTTLIALFIICIIAIPQSTVHAQESSLLEYHDTPTYLAAYSGLSAESSPYDVAQSLITVLFTIIGVAFFVLIVFSGVKWFTAMGNTGKVQEAKDSLRMGIIGFIIMSSSYTIMVTIMTYAGTATGTQTSDEFVAGALADESISTIPTIVSNLGTIALSLVAILVTIFFVYGGYLWLTAAGNGDQAKRAQQIILRAVIGLLITLGAWGITLYVVDALYTATDTGYISGSGSSSTVQQEIDSKLLGE